MIHNHFSPLLPTAMPPRFEVLKSAARRCITLCRESLSLVERLLPGLSLAVGVLMVEELVMMVVVVVSLDVVVMVRTKGPKQKRSEVSEVSEIILATIRYELLLCIVYSNSNHNCCTYFDQLNAPGSGNFIQKPGRDRIKLDTSTVYTESPYFCTNHSC